jgi:hypothetical protein
MSEPVHPASPDPSEAIRRAIIHPIVSHVQGERHAVAAAEMLEQDLRDRFPGVKTRRSMFWDGDGGGEIEVFSDAVHAGVAPVCIFRWPDPADSEADVR